VRGHSILVGMDAEAIRAYLLSLPYVAETMQWGDNLVFWVGDKSIGGKMFALVNLDSVRYSQVIGYAAGPERYAELLEIDGVLPAPYMARMHWVAVRSWNVFPSARWKSELTAAHELIYAKLPPRTKAVLALPRREREALIAERRRLLKSRGRSR
jgi:predicted DNA-binding protein (MmcQ/YjbR family)